MSTSNTTERAIALYSSCVLSMAPPASNADFAIRVFSELGVVHIDNEDRSMLINQLRTEFVQAVLTSIS
ncbi:hypothetical protein [Nitrosococcus oceani]|uniref:hypothetical protein n=1 Tax=Nitrosococcus oceani TaxID=1229 RepID=UPI0004E8AA57|nr:hypothetical protein [Nitrosococcus oceani]KFI21574.1 hypothetical protein HW44_14330 [Nitrosococcus oceani]